MAPRKTSTPKKFFSDKFVITSGLSDYVGKDSSDAWGIDTLSSGYNGYVNVSLAPKDAYTIDPNARPFYVKGNAQHEVRIFRGHGNTWRTVGHWDKAEDGTYVITLDETVEVTTDPKTITLPKMPPSPYEDTPANRKKNQVHAAALRKVLDGFLSLGNKADIVNTIKLMKPEGTAITLKVSDDLDEKLPRLFTEAKAIYSNLDGLDDNDKTSILRHVAHVYDIRKGTTWLR